MTARTRPTEILVSPGVAPDLYLATHSDGSQTLVTLWADASGEIAFRRDQWATWSAPTPLVIARTARRIIAGPRPEPEVDAEVSS